MKKLRIPAACVLLLAAFTAIILHVYRNFTAEPGVPVMTEAARSGPTLVIDAGHGGLDGGASAADGTLESALNLQIALRVEQLAKLFGVSTVMTRSSEALDYPDESATIHAKKVWDQKTRVALINSTENALLLSIHQNTYPDARPNGTEVLYAKTDGSKELAELTHANLINCLNPENRRVAAPISDAIYLMKSVDCTAILVECGFLSNPAETEKLKSGTYQTQLAAVLVGSFLQYSF